MSRGDVKNEDIGNYKRFNSPKLVFLHTFKRMVNDMQRSLILHTILNGRIVYTLPAAVCKTLPTYLDVSSYVLLV